MSAGTGEILEDYDFTQAKGGRKAKYDYETILDGKIRKLVKGRDFDSATRTFKATLEGKARANGKKAQVILEDEDTLVVRLVEK